MHRPRFSPDQPGDQPGEGFYIQSGGDRQGTAFSPVTERSQPTFGVNAAEPNRAIVAQSDRSIGGETTDSGSVQLAQTSEITVPQPSDKVLKEGSLVLGSPYIRFQGVYLLQGDDSSARARFTGLYPILPNLLFGAELDLTTGNAFTDSSGTGFNLNELYLAYSPPNLPNLRLVGGLMDLTSYFDRNSFAKDGTTHFFNPVFQTNPALSAANISSRPGFLVNWSATDNLDLKAAAFSANRNLGDFAINSFAGEIGVRFDNAIIRATYVNTKDNGRRTGFDEIFAIPRSNGDFGFRFSDREEAFGINAEY